MKNRKFNYLKNTLLLGLVLIISINCERDLSDDARVATFSKTAEIFTDDFVAMGSDFYFPYGDSKFTAFSVDREVGYNSSASVRIDVPNANDSEGAYAGGIFRIDGAGRDLSGYDALTFWAKSSQGVTVGEIGFGEDFILNKYIATITNVSVGTNWTKYVIPIPDASKLVQERGMFRYAAGTQGTNGLGYTLWIDEIKFEKLGTIAQPMPAIANGTNLTVDSFIGVSIPITGLRETFNLGSGANQIVVPAIGYFIFKSSNSSVATVNANGQINVVGSGNAIITGNIGGTLNPATNEFEGGVNSVDSITINSLGNFTLAPTPTRNPNNVISIFSDAYTNVPVDFFNGYWQPFQTTQSADFVINGDNILNYTNFNFVGNQFSNPTVDATQKSNLHLNMYIPGQVPSNLDFLITIKDFGPDQADGGGDDTFQQVFFNASNFTANTWSTLEIPITLATRNNIGLIIYENVNGSPLTNFYLDNIYFYEVPTVPVVPTMAAPTPTVPAANVISVFSDAYTNVGADYNPNWGQATAVAQVPIAGNNTLRYTNLNYQGLQLNTSQNVSGMTHLHIDYYTTNSSLLNAYLISTGPVETPKNLAVPTNGAWVSLEIPLSEFSPVNLSDIIQFKFDGNGTIYLDNIYFHN
ncbi:glycosyl hydrolase family 16 [uncultured Flavobacterium sp.]|uniref:glycosyl hydrolase family 16 n=1 Tax=uncultured Flavobacterium sp. TaxID=165435 RepID=UPI0030C871A9